MSALRIAIVTDSSAHIPEQAKGKLNIHVIPLWLIWDEEHLQDGIDITPAAFYARLRGSKTLPTSSQPSVREFEQFFRQLAEEAEAIVAVLVSSKISGTYASAEAAVRNQPDLDIRLVDSLQASMGHGLCVLAAARAAEQKGSVDDAMRAAEEMRDKVNLIFMVDTLEYLHRGGRISGGKRLLGTAL